MPSGAYISKITLPITNLMGQFNHDKGNTNIISDVCITKLCHIMVVEDVTSLRTPDSSLLCHLNAYRFVLYAFSFLWPILSSPEYYGSMGIAK